jgi:hypothetical protein
VEMLPALGTISPAISAIRSSGKPRPVR